MKKISFIEGVGVALISSILVASIFSLMSSMYFGDNVLRALISGVSFFYILYLFLRSEERVGQVTTLSIWSALTVFSFIFLSPLIMFIGFQLVLVWLIRSLYFYNSVISALIDLVLISFSLVFSIWAWSSTGSLFLTFWCFFLTQALFIFIPKNYTTKQSLECMEDEDNFECAYFSAESAVSKLINNK